MNDEAFDAAELDQAYVPLEQFGVWAGAVVDATLYNDASERFKAASSARPDAAEGAITQALRAAAMETGAIEGLYETNHGLTLTVAAQAPGWETELLVGGDRTRDFFMAQLKGYECALAEADDARLLAEVTIRQLHEIICAPQAEYDVLTSRGWQRHALLKGQYKELPNHRELADGRLRSYAPVEQVRPEMTSFVQTLQSGTFAAANPLVQAAYAHFGLTHIHPFADGNGRVARALASVFLLRGFRVPLLVWSGDRLRYIGALETAEDGVREPVITFFTEQVADSLEWLADLPLHPVRDIVESNRATYESHGGLTHTEIDQIGSVLLAAFGEVIRERTLELVKQTPPEISAYVGSLGGLNSPSENYRVLTNYQAWMVTITSQPPANANINRTFDLLINKRSDDHHPYRLFVREDNAPLDVRLNEVRPNVTDGLRLKMTSWTDAALARALELLFVEAERSARSRGLL